MLVYMPTKIGPKIHRHRELNDNEERLVLLVNMFSKTPTHGAPYTFRSKQKSREDRIPTGPHLEVEGGQTALPQGHGAVPPRKG